MGILCLTGGIIRTIVSIIIVTRSIVPRSVFTKSSSIKLYKEDKGLLFNSDPWPPAEQKLEMPCDIRVLTMQAKACEDQSDSNSFSQCWCVLFTKLTKKLSS